MGLSTGWFITAKTQAMMKNAPRPVISASGHFYFNYIFKHGFIIISILTFNIWYDNLIFRFKVYEGWFPQQTWLFDRFGKFNKIRVKP